MNKKLLFKIGSGLTVGCGSLFGAQNLSVEYVNYNEENLFRFPKFFCSNKMYEMAIRKNFDVWNMIETDVKS